MSAVVSRTTVTSLPLARRRTHDLSWVDVSLQREESIGVDYSRCSDTSTQLKSWVRRLASGKEVTVVRETTAPIRVLARHLDYIWGLCN
jgi:hypothetical protein